MAILAGRLASSRRALRGAAPAALLAGLGCFAQPDGGEAAVTSAFSHRIHTEEGLACSDCHAGVEDSDEPGMPRLPACMLCHADLDEEKPVERQVKTLYAGEDPAGPRISEVGDEVVFSHLLHVGSGLECFQCHGRVEESDALGFEVAVPMAECVDCHARSETAEDGCANCHSVIDEQWAPPTHAHAWRRLHGGMARAELGGPRNDCALCHTESTCVACHREEPPENHTNYWRRRGHTFTAAMDRESCQTCHQSDFCNRCHAHTEPLSHTGSFGGTLSTHCLSCHFPLSAEEGCGVCHKGTPSHLLATPKPPDHTPGMNCLQCHGAGQPLPHVDKGDDCNICHK